MSVMSSPSNHIGRFTQVSRSNRITLEQFRVSRFNKALSTISAVVLFVLTISGTYDFSAMKYLLTVLMFAAATWVVWTFGDAIREGTECDDQEL